MRRIHVALPLLLAVLLALAGCASTAQLTSPNEPTEDELPPGVSQHGVENTSALLVANADALDNSGYAARIELRGTATLGSDNQSTRSVRTNATQTVRVAAGGRPVLVTGETDVISPMGNRSQSSALWANETTTLTRIGQGNQTRYSAVDKTPGGGQLLPSTEQQLRRVISSSNFSVTGVERSLGETRTVLTASEPAPTLDGVTSYEATLVVDSSGRIHTATHRIVIESEQRTQTVELRYELTETNVETVEQPEWADKAQASQSSA